MCIVVGECKHSVGYYHSVHTKTHFVTIRYIMVCVIYK